MQDLLDPKNDYVFKRLFADSPDLLAALVNAVRPRAAPVTRLEVKNPEIAPEELRGKYIVLDLLAEDSAGARFNIEMQVRRFRAWGARSTFYLARLVSGQLVAGEDYSEMKPAIGIHLLGFDLFDAPEHAHQALWCFEMRDADTPAVSLGEELQLSLVELRKADRLGQAPPALAAWIAFFEHWQEEDTMNRIADEPVRAAYGKLKSLSADDETRRLAFVRERALFDEASLLKDARDEGREEGRAEALRATALNLVRSGALDDEAIAAATGLRIEDIAALREASR